MEKTSKRQNVETSREQDVEASDGRDLGNTVGSESRKGREAGSHVDVSTLGRFDVSAVDPLPQKYLIDGEGIGGRIKVRPEDFLVDEQPLYQPSGKGEHLYLFIEKRNVSHVELMATLRKRFGVGNKAIGFAGMKDKVGVTRQLVSIHTREGAAHGSESRATFDLDHDRIAVLWADRHLNKIKRGHLAGNRFSIRIREVDPLHAPRALRTLRALERMGVPNYFGSQRFGYRHNNHLLGALLLAGRYEELLEELLGTQGRPFPEYQRERREMFGQRRYAEALSMWTPADASERSALRALAKERSAKRACYAVGVTTWEFWISAMQSAIFNRNLDQRIDDELLCKLIEGDLAWKHSSRGVFAISAELAGDPEIHARLERLEISPTGPLWGKRLTRAPVGSSVDDVEVSALKAMGFAPESLAGVKDGPDGSRRPLREPIRNVDVDSGLDEHGPYIRVAFDLPRGVYATIALREVMKSPVDED